MTACYPACVPWLVALHPRCTPSPTPPQLRACLLSGHRWQRGMVLFHLPLLYRRLTGSFQSATADLDLEQQGSSRCAVSSKDQHSAVCRGSVKANRACQKCSSTHQTVAARVKHEDICRGSFGEPTTYSFQLFRTAALFLLVSLVLAPLAFLVGLSPVPPSLRPFALPTLSRFPLLSHGDRTRLPCCLFPFFPCCCPKKDVCLLSRRSIGDRAKCCLLTPLGRFLL